MKKISLQWRLTCIITLYIAVICGCVTMLVYKNGVYYMDSLQEAVDTRGDDQPDDAEEIYISIPEAGSREVAAGGRHPRLFRRRQHLEHGGGRHLRAAPAAEAALS